MSSPSDIKEIRTCDLGKFQFKRVLNDDPRSKFLCVEGRFDTNEDSSAVVLLEKTPFNQEKCHEIFDNETDQKQTFHNDVYSGYTVHAHRDVNEIKATVIYPATEKHIEKYSRQEGFLVRETGTLYREKVEPYITKNCLSVKWVYNILDRKDEQESILFEDDDPDLGFMLCKDMKWDQKQVEDLHCLVIVHRRDIRSIRDLRGEHLPLLENIKSKTTSFFKDKYGMGEEKVMAYFHYQPSYYHLHLHMVAITYENPPGGGCQRGHLLDTLISNLQLDGDYYKKATLCYTVKEKDSLKKIIFEEKPIQEKPSEVASTGSPN